MLSRRNLENYSRNDVVTEYDHMGGLTAVEEFLLTKYIRHDMRILDLGVGAGRTTAYLAAHAKDYVGVDYSPAMIDACKAKYPQLKFLVRDASDLSALEDDYFDAVIFSFNGMGYIWPDSRRSNCLSECCRVLKPGGVLVFSLHYAHSLFFWPPFPRSAKSTKALFKSVFASAKRFSERIVTAMFWTGRGYLQVDVHGGLLTFFTSPQTMRKELASCGFEMKDVISDAYPRINIPPLTRWYYYSAFKFI